jgi:hypothetical protein
MRKYVTTVNTEHLYREETQKKRRKKRYNCHFNRSKTIREEVEEERERKKRTES